MSGTSVPCHFSSDVRLQTAKIELNEATCMAFPTAMKATLVVVGAANLGRKTKNAIWKRGNVSTCMSHISGRSQENRALNAKVALLTKILIDWDPGNCWVIISTPLGSHHGELSSRQFRTTRTRWPSI